MEFLLSIFTNALPFIPFAFAVMISFSVLRATDMTLDGSFVLGAGIFAKLLTLGFPPFMSAILAILSGLLAGILVAFIQRGGRVDPLLAGVLATFILASLSLVLMGRPNISLLSITTLLSSAFAKNELMGWGLVTFYHIVVLICLTLLLSSAIGLRLRALGDNPELLTRLGYSLENYRMLGFGISNGLAAYAGMMMSQTNGFADVGMGFGMTLTGVGAIILGRQLFIYLFKRNLLRICGEFFAALMGVILYFSMMVVLLQCEIDPIYLKMIMGLMLVFILRSLVVIPGRRVAAL